MRSQWILHCDVKFVCSISRQITLRVNISADHAYSHTYNGRHGRMWKDWYRSKSFKGELDNSIKKTITLLKNIDFPCVCLLIWSKLVKKYRFYSSFGLLSLSVRRAATARGRGKNTTSQLNPPLFSSIMDDSGVSRWRRDPVKLFLGWGNSTLDAYVLEISKMAASRSGKRRAGKPPVFSLYISNMNTSILEYENRHSKVCYDVQIVEFRYPLHSVIAL